MFLQSIKRRPKSYMPQGSGDTDKEQAKRRAGTALFNPGVLPPRFIVSTVTQRRARPVHFAQP